MTKLRAGMTALAFGAAMAASAPAAAQNRVTNGGFETGSFSGWTLNDPSNNTAVLSGSQRTGTYYAGLGADPNTGTLSQNISTTAGQRYTFSFYVRGDNAGTNQFDAFFGNTTVYSQTNLRNTGGAYQLLSFNATATGTTTNIGFRFTDSANRIALDDVSVVVAAAAPEPASWGLMILGFGVVGTVLRRRRRAGGTILTA